MNHWHQHKRLLGLTGGIASGKSTVAHYLHRRYQLPILDADVYAKQAVANGSPILTAIAQRYGEKILLPDATLNRQALGEIIFANPDEKEWVEHQIHPFVRNAFQQTIKNTAASTLVLDIPLLFEAQLTDYVTEIWVVACRPEQQLQRLCQRNQISIEQAQSRISSQWPMAKKISLADVVIDNDQDLAHLEGQVDQIMGQNDFGNAP